MCPAQSPDEHRIDPRIKLVTRNNASFPSAKRQREHELDDRAPAARAHDLLTLLQGGETAAVWSPCSVSCSPLVLSRTWSTLAKE